MRTLSGIGVFVNKLVKHRNLTLIVGLAIFLATVLALAVPAETRAQEGRTLDLATLSVTDQNGTKIDVGTFAAATKSYSADVATTVERVTVTATPKEDVGVYVRMAPNDSQTDVADHQIDLNYGKNLIIIGVYSYSYVPEPLQVYTVEIDRAGSAPQDSVSYVSSSSIGTAKEGSTVPFLFTRTGDSSGALKVSVDIWESSDTGLIEIIPGIDPVSIQERVQVEFLAGHSSVILNQDTSDDSIDTGSYYLGVTAVAGTGYQIPAYEGYASSLIWDDDNNKPTLASLRP